MLTYCHALSLCWFSQQFPIKHTIGLNFVILFEKQLPRFGVAGDYHHHIAFLSGYPCSYNSPRKYHFPTPSQNYLSVLQICALWVITEAEPQ